MQILKGSIAGRLIMPQEEHEKDQEVNAGDQEIDMMRLITFCAATLAAAVPTCVAAETNAPFTTSPLSDFELARVSGAASPYGSMTRGNLLKLVDAQNHVDVRQFGSIGRIQMDVWWGTTGSELIANATRGSTERP